MLPSPPGWGADPLTGFFDQIRNNQYATFVNKPDWFGRIGRLDRCFAAVEKGWADPHNLVSAMLFSRSHAAFRTAAACSTAGQVAESFVLLRSCIEYAAYALHIDRHPGLDEVLLRREESKENERRVRAEFQVGRIKQTLDAIDPEAGRRFTTLYDRTIAFGAHPNELGLTGNMTIRNVDDGKRMEQAFLQGDGPALMHALKTTAQCGLCALEMLQHVFEPRFRLQGVTDELLRLRDGL